jgi:hypothetical protein
MSGHGGSKRFRRLQNIIEPYGLVIRPLRSGHNGIFNQQGARIYTMSGSPKNVYQAIDNTLKDLKKCGHVPREVRLK